MLIALANAALAQCIDADSLWSVPTEGVGAVSEISADTGILANHSFTYAAQGGTLWALDNTAGGATVWSRDMAGAAAVFSGAVPETVVYPWDPPASLYVGGSDGFVHKLEALTGKTWWESGLWSADARRPDCALDGLTAAPAIQLRTWSDPAFQAAHYDDVAMIALRARCGSTTETRVVGLSNAWPQWTFNADGSQSVDFVASGCAIDYAHDLLFCGAHADTAIGQPTLVAIRTTDGTLAWSDAIGSVHATPHLLGAEVWAVAADGTVHGYDAATGAPRAPLPLGTPVRGDFWAEFRGVEAGILLVPLSTGELALVDTNVEPSVEIGRTLPIPGAATVAVEPTSAKAYVGGADGRIVQVDLATLAIEASAFAGTTQVTAFALDFELGSASIDRLVAATSGEIHRYCIPWQPGWQGVN